MQRFYCDSNIFPITTENLSVIADITCSTKNYLKLIFPEHAYGLRCILRDFISLYLQVIYSIIVYLSNPLQIIWTNDAICSSPGIPKWLSTEPKVPI